MCTRQSQTDGAAPTMSVQSISIVIAKEGSMLRTAKEREREREHRIGVSIR